jgi:biopolymer transport protein ExbD
MKIRFFDLRQARKGPEINMAPLIDMVFQLVLFFAVATTFPENTGVQIDKPDASFKAILPQNGITIAISSEGRYFYDGKNITLRDIGEILKKRVAENEKIGVIIMADKNSITKSVIDLMDMAKASGAKGISIATDEKMEDIK